MEEFITQGHNLSILKKDFSDEDMIKLYATYEYDMILLFDNTYSKRKAEIASLAM